MYIPFSRKSKVGVYDESGKDGGVKSRIFIDSTYFAGTITQISPFMILFNIIFNQGQG